MQAVPALPASRLASHWHGAGPRPQTATPTQHAPPSGPFIMPREAGEGRKSGEQRQFLATLARPHSSFRPRIVVGSSRWWAWPAAKRKRIGWRRLSSFVQSVAPPRALCTLGGGGGTNQSGAGRAPRASPAARQEAGLERATFCLPFTCHITAFGRSSSGSGQQRPLQCARLAWPPVPSSVLFCSVLFC